MTQIPCEVEPSRFNCYRGRSVNNLLEHVGQSIRERKLFRRGETVLVAVSGGLDSMALLHLLHTLSATNQWRLCVAHFNHRLRGRSSDADERLVRRTALRLGLNCVCAAGDVKGHATKTGVSIEMAARELRHGFLARTARQLRIRTVALAHHADDQVELFFLRMLRGAGGEGLSGMKWRSPSPATSTIQLARPLLDVSKADLNAFASERRIHFREDASNASLDLQRNLIRHDLLPRLRRRYQPALDKIILRIMEIVGAEAEVVGELANACLKLRRASLSAWPVGLQRRMLQQQLQERVIPAEYELIESLRANPGKIINVAPQISIERDEAGRLHFSAPKVASFDAAQVTLSILGKPRTAVFDDVRFRWSFDAPKRNACIVRQPGYELFDAAKVGSPIMLRHWRAGDRFQPIGMPKPIKLQDWFTNRKIPRNERHQLILATTADGQVFWVEGQRIDERFKLTSATRKRLIWRWERGVRC